MTQETCPKGLKCVVIALGLVLIGGAIWVFGALASKSGKAPDQVAEACAENKRITLKNMGEVQQFDSVGGYLRIGLLDKERGQYSVVMIDPCTNEVKSRVAVVTK